jgi:hypothetical protein
MLVRARSILICQNGPSPQRRCSNGSKNRMIEPVGSPIHPAIFRGPVKLSTKTRGSLDSIMRSIVFRIFNAVVIALGCVAVAWLGFIDPVEQAFLNFAENGWLAIAGAGASVLASLLGVAAALWGYFLR